jgi:hypothetical protein
MVKKLFYIKSINYDKDSQYRIGLKKSLRILKLNNISQLIFLYLA